MLPLSDRATAAKQARVMIAIMNLIAVKGCRYWPGRLKATLLFAKIVPHNMTFALLHNKLFINIFPFHCVGRVKGFQVYLGHLPYN